MADAARAVRVDMRAIGNAEAVALIAEYDPYVQRCASKAHANDRDDCISIGRIALLEAASNYDDRCGISLRAWVKRLILWRITEYRKSLMEEYVMPVGTSAFGLDSATKARNTTNGMQPWAERPETLEETIERRDMCRLIQEGFTDLDLRDQVIISATMVDETISAAAASLGITKQRASVLRIEALQKIREHVDVFDDRRALTG